MEIINGLIVNDRIKILLPDLLWLNCFLVWLLRRCYTLMFCVRLSNGEYSKNHSNAEHQFWLFLIYNYMCIKIGGYVSLTLQRNLSERPYDLIAYTNRGVILTIYIFSHGSVLVIGGLLAVTNSAISSREVTLGIDISGGWVLVLLVRTAWNHCRRSKWLSGILLPHTSV